MKILLFTLPAMVPMFLFWIYPILKSGWLSFTDWDYMSPSYSYVGFENYTDLFQDDRFWNALKVTGSFALGTFVPTIIFGLALALLLQSKLRGKSIYQFLSLKIFYYYF